MHVDGKSTLASVSKWNSGKVNWQRIPATRLTFGGEVMVPRDNSTLAFSTELLNCIITLATQGKSGHYKIFDGWPSGFLFATLMIKRGCSVWLKNLRFPFIFLFMKSKVANFA